MAELRLGDDWRIRRYDPLNIVLERRTVAKAGHRWTKEAGQESWHRVAYCTDLQAALESYVDKVIEPGEAEVVLAKIAETKAAIAEALQDAQNHAILTLKLSDSPRRRVRVPKGGKTE